jgi:site-specific DNA-cytosine methylase
LPALRSATATTKRRSEETMIHVSLFTGIGGIDLAAEMAGFRSAAVCEIDPKLRRVLALNFPEAVQFGDVKEVTGEALRRDGIGRVDLLSAGFPCQPHSVAGKRKADADPRDLWPEVVRVLGEVKPRWFLGENVRGLLSSADGRMLGGIFRDLADLGYRVGWGTWGADEACQASHRRDRVFIVGHLANCQGKRSEGLSLSGEQRAAGSDTDGQGANLGDSAVSNKPGFFRRQKERPQGSGKSLAYSGHERSERRKAPDLSRGEESADRTARYGSSFPPGPGDLDAWRRVALLNPDLLPALSREAEAELSVRPVADGISRRMALKAIGNAVVPAQVLVVLEEIASFERGRAA